VSGLRVARKQATRERVLTAARELFDDIGYEAATVRMIAGRAGVATGSVFTTFANKLEILREVMEDRLESLYADIEKVTPHLRGSVADRLCSLMAVQYAFEMRRPRLFTAYLAANFEWNENNNGGEPIISFGRNARVRGFMQAILKDGMARGEVRPDADIDTFIEILISAYGFNYRKAVQNGYDATALIAVMDKQIYLMVSGVRA
jgi:AcrR family transcriptional regulator